jgi:hypothetical protein
VNFHPAARNRAVLETSLDQHIRAAQSTATRHPQATRRTPTEPNLSGLTRDLLRNEQGKNRSPSAASGGHVRAHDVPRTAASYMGEAGVDRFHIAYVLNHRSITNSFADTGGVPVPGPAVGGALALASSEQYSNPAHPE